MLQRLCVVVMVMMMVVDQAHSFKWKQCGPQDTVVVNEFDISPSPVKMGQPASISFRGETLRSLNRSDIKLDMTRLTFILDIHMPCLNNFGSCLYKDSCTLLNRMKGWSKEMSHLVSQFESLMARENVQLGCSAPPQKIDVDGLQLDLPVLPSVAAFVFQGNYKVKIMAIDRHTRRTNFCFEIKLSIDA